MYVHRDIPKQSGDFGWLWVALGGSGWLWVALGRLWAGAQVASRSLNSLTRPRVFVVDICGVVRKSGPIRFGYVVYSLSYSLRKTI